MAIIITNIEMPKSCNDCFKKTECFFAQCNGWIGDKRDDNCPLKEVKEAEDCISRQAVEEICMRHKADDCIGIYEEILDLSSVHPKSDKSVLKDIKNEIEKAYEDFDGYDPNALPLFADTVDEIIEKHIRGFLPTP